MLEALIFTRKDCSEEREMRRISGDYVATKAGRCEICQRAILPGMYCFDVELRGGRRAKCHSLCEEELKKT
jgi:hypothetical protein